MSFTVLSIAIIVITAAIIFRHVRMGYKKGMSKALIHLGILLFSAVFSAVVSFLLAKLVGTLVFTAFGETGVIADLKNSVGFVFGVIQLLIQMILSVILYIPIFYIMKLVVKALVGAIIKLVAKKCKKPKKEPEYMSENTPFYVRHDKKIGAIVGAISGLLVAIVVFMPLTGLLNTSSDVVDFVMELTQKEDTEKPEALQLLDRYASDTSSTVLQACGGRVLFDLTARTSMEGQSTCLNREIRVLRDLKLMERKNEITGGGLTLEATQALERFVQDGKDSLCLRVMTTDILKNLSSNWIESRPFMGINRPSFGENRALDRFFNSLFSVCSTTSIQTYDQDIYTIIHLLQIFLEDDVKLDLNDYDAFKTFIDEQNGMQRIKDVLNENPRMSTVNVAMDDMIMMTLATEIDSSKYTVEQKKSFYKGIASILNDANGLDGSVRSVAIANGIREKFADHGSELPENLEELVAETIATRFSGNETVTEQDVEEYFAEYLEENEG